MAEYSGGSPEADHLCVLVHGLWGNPDHMTSIAKSLRAQYPADQVYILCARRNAGSFTYDGVELGGERVCLEIEEELQVIESKGGKIQKLSIVGYSLGGCVARYAIGLLQAKGVLDNLECMNFTAFASPFLGVRTPIKGVRSHLWNVLGARTLSASGRQLFTIDNFRDTGRPLFEVLTDPKSIFMSGLKKFKRRTLYANVTNDRSAVWYTTGISTTDPFVDMSKVKVSFLKGYEDVILDPSKHVTAIPPPPEDPLGVTASKWLKRTPLLLALALFMPVGLLTIIGTSLVQTVRSSKRIRIHEKGLAGIDISSYRGPLWIKELREAVEDVYENLNSTQDQQYLSLSDNEGDAIDNAEDREVLALERTLSQPEQPTLALTPSQFAMIRNLDSVGWRKYPVWIHKVRHSHAAIIVRKDTPNFSEGLLVLKHWLEEEFLA